MAPPSAVADTKANSDRESTVRSWRLAGLLNLIARNTPSTDANAIQRKRQSDPVSKPRINAKPNGKAPMRIETNNMIGDRHDLDIQHLNIRITGINLANSR